MPAVSRRVQCRSCLGEVLPDDARIADLLVALCELIVRKADGPGGVCELGVFQGPRMQGDGARLIATGKGEAPVEAPHVGELLASERIH